MHSFGGVGEDRDEYDDAGDDENTYSFLHSVINHTYSNSAFTLLTKCSTETGFLIKHPIFIAGYISLKASWFTSADDIKQILGLGSMSNICR